MKTVGAFIKEKTYDMIFAGFVSSLQPTMNIIDAVNSSLYPHL
jgi:hypothetical protein